MTKFREPTAGAVALGAALLVGASAATSPTQAAFVVALEQDGSNVVATGSGTLDLTDLTFVVTDPVC